MTVHDMASYAKRYSPSVKKETTIDQLEKLANTSVVSKKVGWEGNFNDMALKTVIRRLLSKYGYLSIEMQGAMAADDDTMSNRDMVLDGANAQVINIDTTFELSIQLRRSLRHPLRLRVKNLQTVRDIKQSWRVEL